MKQAIYTDKAPPCSGTYSQAIKVGNTVYLAGQIPLDPETQQLVSPEISVQAVKAFENLKIVAVAAGGNLDAIVRISVYLTDLADFPLVNDVMKTFFSAPYPARTTIGVKALPKGALIEVDGIMVI